MSFSTQANCKENVYKMEDLVPLSQLQHFIATAEALLDSKQPDTEAYSELFRSCFNNARGEVAEVGAVTLVITPINNSNARAHKLASTFPCGDMQNPTFARQSPKLQS